MRTTLAALALLATGCIIEENPFFMETEGPDGSSTGFVFPTASASSTTEDAPSTSSSTAAESLGSSSGSSSSGDETTSSSSSSGSDSTGDGSTLGSSTTGDGG